MKRVLEWREVRRDRSKVDVDWMFGHNWRLRRVRCDCGNEWWEIVEPRQYAEDKECACRVEQGKGTGTDQ